MNIIHETLIQEAKPLLEAEGFTVIPQERVSALLETGRFVYVDPEWDKDDVHLFLADQYAEILVNINAFSAISQSQLAWAVEWKTEKSYGSLDDSEYDTFAARRLDSINSFVIPELNKLLSEMKSVKQVMSELV